MYHLAYFSTSAQHFSEEDLNVLLATSQKNNKSIGITGVLLFIEGCFLQVLEGNEQSVKALYNKIKKDNRHYDLLTIFEGKKEERNFSKWSMGFRNLPLIEYKNQTDFEDLSDEDFINKILKTFHPKIAQTLNIFYSDGI